MKNVCKLAALGALSLAAISTAARKAEAQYPCAPYWGYGAYPGYPYDAANVEHVPYFALHPPVYYSMPVARTYGYSPFAYPPGVMTPEIAAPAPAEIINPYVPQPPAKEKPTSNKTAGVQPRIVNPYVTPEAKETARGIGE